jgi:hypothetical protein
MLCITTDDDFKIITTMTRRHPSHGTYNKSYVGIVPAYKIRTLDGLWKCNYMSLKRQKK